jgi:hypothetical protein
MKHDVPFLNQNPNAEPHKGVTLITHKADILCRLIRGEADVGSIL